MTRMTPPAGRSLWGFRTVSMLARKGWCQVSDEPDISELIRSLEAVREAVDCVISLCEVVRPGLDLFPEVQRYHWRIPDPVGGSLDDYRYTRDLIWTQLKPLLARLLETDDLPERLIVKE